MGDGIVAVTDHEKWKARSALLYPGFHRKYVKQNIIIQFT